MQRTPYGGGPERHSRTRATRCRNEAARSPAARGLYRVERPAVSSDERTIPALTLVLAGPVLYMLVVLLGLPPLLGQTDRIYYRDGNRVIFLTVAEDLLVEKSKTGDLSLRTRDTERPVPVRSASTSDNASGESRDDSGEFPVFRTDTGQLVSPVGGVILSLDRSWSSQAVDEFLEANDLEDVEPLGIPNVYLVDTEAGLEAIEFANRLARLPGVVSCSPNLWTEEVEQ